MPIFLQKIYTTTGKRLHKHIVYKKNSPPHRALHGSIFFTHTLPSLPLELCSLATKGTQEGEGQGWSLYLPPPLPLIDSSLG